MSLLLAYPFFAGVRPGFRVYDQTAGTLILEFGEDTYDLGGDAWQVPFSALNLAPGRWLLGVSRGLADGCESEIVSIAVEVGDGGAPAYRVRAPSRFTVNPVEVGRVRVAFGVEPDDDCLADPDDFQVAILDAPDSTLLTIPFDRQRASYRATLGPYTHAQTLRFIVRSKSDVGVYSRWVESLPVVVDAEGPEPAELLNVVSGSC